jgi:two-component system nitrate/nitrite response regulator NarL
MGTPTSLLVSGSDRMYCDFLCKAFASARNKFHIVASASSSAEILAAIRETRPEVAIVSSDLQDGPSAGIRHLALIRKAHPGLRILVSMGSPDSELVVEAFRLGASGVFCRKDPFELLCKAVEIVSQGQIWANTEQLHHVLDAFVNSPKQRSLHPTLEKRITKRETAVVRLAVEGLSNREIARHLTLTEHTVKNYLFRVFEKLNVSNRVELVLFCLRQEEAAPKQLALPVEREFLRKGIMQSSASETKIIHR